MKKYHLLLVAADDIRDDADWQSLLKEVPEGSVLPKFLVATLGMPEESERQYPRRAYMEPSILSLERGMWPEDKPNVLP